MNHSPNQIGNPDAETAPLRRPTPDATDYPWHDLPSLDPDTVELTNRLLDLLPLGDDDTLDGLADCLTEITALPHTLDFHRIRAHTADDPPPTFGDAYATRFHLPPDPETGALLLDAPLVEHWIATLRRETPDVRPAGDQDHRDFGLATYLIVRAFDWLKSERGAPPVVFPTEPPLRDVLLDRLEAADRLIEATYVFSTDRNRHLARLLIPEGLIRNCEVFHRGAPSRRASTKRLLDGPLADLAADLRLSLGRTTLAAGTFDELAARDVLLFDEHGYAPDETDRDTTPPAAHLDLGGDVHLIGHASPGPSRWKFRPIDLTPRSDEPDTMTDATPDDADAPSADPNDPGPTELLETPDVRLDVRLGSTAMTIRELGRMQPGRVITLDARVGEPVELVVDDRVVGEGELVEVEGRLGVRVRWIER